MDRTVEGSLPVAVLTHDSLSSVLWADSTIESIECCYDRVVISLKETTGRDVRVQCHGHIGLLVKGFWDEVVIASADLIEAHPFGEKSLESVRERLGAEPPPTGSP